MKQIAFLGSPEFALPTLQLLKSQQDINIQFVATKPDKPAGRGMQLTPTPVKQAAQELKLKVLEKLPADLGDLDLLVVVAYGLMIPDEIVKKYLCVNLHPSLLPKYRGPSPLQSALLNGEHETGISTMLLNEKMDEGDVLLQERFVLPENMNIQELHDICAQKGAELILETLRRDINQIRHKQNAAEATYCKKIISEDSEIKPGESAWQIHNKIRAVGGVLLHNGKRVKLTASQFADNKITLLKVQPEGKPVMDYKDFVNGYGEITLTSVQPPSAATR